MLISNKGIPINMQNEPVPQKPYLSGASLLAILAEKDAVAHLHRTLWFSTGCFFPLVGPIFSQCHQPFMPTARVLGKSPQYVAFYYDAYKVKTKKLQYNWALAGCLIGAPIGGYLLTVLYRTPRD